MHSNLIPASKNEWCQIKETLTMSCLSAAQIETSTHEDTEAFQQLSDATLSIAKASQVITENLTLTSLNDQDTSVDKLRSSAKEISDQVSLSITACQFHDQNTQLLEHVTEALSKVCSIISIPGHYQSQDHWEQLQLDIRDSYTMETKRIMFEHIMMGASVEEALDIYHHNFNQAPLEDDSGDDIELF